MGERFLIGGTDAKRTGLGSPESSNPGLSPPEAKEFRVRRKGIESCSSDVGEAPVAAGFILNLSLSRPG